MRTTPLRILVLCTGNSARSQMAEALLNLKGAGRIVAESAGSHPAARVSKSAIEALREVGIEWSGHQPRGMDGLAHQHWDAVITVCDHARESCPLFPGHPIVAHWGMPDPAKVEESNEARRQAFREALVVLSRRIDLMLALPIESLPQAALEASMNPI
jgi:arsenate reductase